jgi:nucleotide-binding universal stress UspA family protein
MYKTILVHVDLSSHAPARMRYAAALGRTHGAHLLGAAMLGVSKSIPGALGAGYVDPLAGNARQALSAFEDIAREMQVPYDTRFVCDQADDGLALLARFADLVVISQDDPAESLAEMAVHLPEYVILNSARPVLVVPRTDPPPDAGHKVLVAWNGSKEAARALDAAIPLLRHSTEVHLAALTGPDINATDFLAQRTELTRFLGHHRVTPRFLVREAQRDGGHALLTLADELGCGTLVMGCYGHSKFRELCLGGASRTVLDEARIPVLLAH